jgi:bisphosphoglycerate-dependent phosphoglycerate mutase
MAYGPQKITGTMPFRYHKDDAAWIDAQLSLLGAAERAKVASAYGKHTSRLRIATTSSIRRLAQLATRQIVGCANI